MQPHLRNRSRGQNLFSSQNIVLYSDGMATNDDFAATSVKSQRWTEFVSVQVEKSQRQRCRWHKKGAGHLMAYPAHAVNPILHKIIKGCHRKNMHGPPALKNYFLYIDDSIPSPQPDGKLFFNYCFRILFIQDLLDKPFVAYPFFTIRYSLCFDRPLPGLRIKALNRIQFVIFAPEYPVEHSRQVSVNSDRQLSCPIDPDIVFRYNM